MVVPVLSDSGSLLAAGGYVEEPLTTLVTVDTVDLVNREREKLPSVQAPCSMVTQVSVPLVVTGRSADGCTGHKLAR